MTQLLASLVDLLQHQQLRDEIKAINKSATNALDWQIKSQSIVQKLLLLNAKESAESKPLTKLSLLNKVISNHWDFHCVFKNQTALEYLNQHFTTQQPLEKEKRSSL